MRRAGLALPAAALLLLAGCGDAAEAALEPAVRDSAGVLIQEFPSAVIDHRAFIRLAEVPTVRIGVIEGAAEYQWARPVAGGRLSNGGFAILEQAPAEVRVFDRSGDFLHRAGVEGDGPGELRAPVALAVLPGDTLLVWDRGSQRLNWFSVDGSLERERTLREPGGIRAVRRMALSPGGTAMVLGATTTEEDLANQGRVRETWQVVPLTPDGEGEPPVGTVRGTERAIRIQRSDAGQVVSVNIEGRWWWGEGFAWGSDRGAWTADALSLEARHFDRERGLDRIVRVLAPDRPFTRSLIDSLHRVELDRVADPEIRELWRADFQGREYPEGVPPVAAVFSDAAGRLWVGLSEPPPERLPSGELPAVRRWIVFEEEGPPVDGSPEPLRLLGILILPERSHPLWADADGVLLVRSDRELDVAFIEWWPYMDG